MATQTTVAVDEERRAETASVEAPRSRPVTTRRPTTTVLGIAALAVMAVLWLLPLAWALATSLKSEAAASALPPRWIPEDGFTLEAYRGVLATGNFPVWLLNSAIVAAVVTAVTLVISALAAYGFSRTSFRGRNLLLAIVVASIIVPPQTLIVPLFYEMLALNLVDTYWGIILPQVVHPVMVYILKKFFDAIPAELEDAARVDGAGRLRILWSVVLPLSRGILAAVAIFVFIGAWNNFLWPFIVTNNPDLMTMPVGLGTVESAYGVQYARDMASAVLAALPLLVVFLFFQRQIIRSFATTGLGGQ